ncbi:MAG: aminotransferase class V-fold PLP-dependent enzyme [Bacteroidales bacterium]|nr:aminotransferase class V-fold PLP-dependent enzyme [Bacteroidales bacterium]MBK7171639.1 aminotransferase class V-fold PLP-dependent enzyme [Bacteroidales bacterium]
MTDISRHFLSFREGIIGNELEYSTAYGKQTMVYADWVASGRLYQPIEDRITQTIGPWVANTHTETCETGQLMTKAYHHAQQIIKKHVNASPSDVLVTTGFGMTAALVKFQRILNLKSCGLKHGRDCIKEEQRPVVFVTHMEHHSNQTSWYYTIADVEVIPPGEGLLVDPENLRVLLEKYKNRELKIGSFTACSNVTGIETPYHELARVMHEAGGYCFIDFAASAPYSDIDMHPADPMEKLDAIFFSPHKFLGGPGSSGILIFDSLLYKREDPDQPGGGTVDWTNPWGEFKFVDDIETREDGGTPGFLQAMRTAMCIRIKEKMGVKLMREREDQLVLSAFSAMEKIPGLHILADNVRNRLGIISFYIDNIHYNLVVKLLSDRFGIQVRGGCACAGTYGHFLLDVSYEQSKEITDRITHGDLSQKPGWIRLSLHPTMTDKELDNVMIALQQISVNHKSWVKDYLYNKHTNEFIHIDEWHQKDELVSTWFTFEK